MLTLVVLISGRGSNLHALIERCAAPDFPARIAAVGADRPAPGLAGAAAAGIPTFTVAPAAEESREQWAKRLDARLAEWPADLIVLSGFMRVLPAAFVARHRLINTHPAYLPEFKGAHAVRDALAAHVAETGATVHRVDASLDGGPVLAQRRVPVLVGDTEPVLHARIKVVERELLAQVIAGIAAGEIGLGGSEQQAALAAGASADSTAVGIPAVLAASPVPATTPKPSPASIAPSTDRKPRA
ncbi:MAG: phosphoribosylglycinamide formyltransferase [Pseudoclavibacter sp.]